MQPPRGQYQQRGKGGTGGEKRSSGAEVRQVRTVNAQPQALEDLEADKGATTFQGYNKWNFTELPIVKHKREFLYAVETNSCVVVIAETGSGKTTKLPQFLLEAGYTMEGEGGLRIGVTLPRRIAAISVAQRVALELNSEVGDIAGYNVRFEQKSGRMINFMTDGMLLSEVLRDPLLSQYSVLMVDDIHERTVNTDLVLGVLKKIRRRRPHLKLIVSSATLDAERISRFFQERDFKSVVLHVEGRVFPVDLFYLPQPCVNYVLKALEIVQQIVQEKREGDVLVFLTSQEEIESFCTLADDTSLSNTQTLVLPLYSQLPLERQMEVFAPLAPPATRKIVVATNIAESSITLEGVVYVVDCMMQKLKYYDHARGYETLATTQVSRAAADQRAGRAGRVRRGECYRLCTQEDFTQRLFAQNVPEILRAPLADFVVRIKALGVRDVASFDLLSQPSDEALARALEELFSLKIIDRECALTEDVGKVVTELSTLDARRAAMLVASYREEFACSAEIVSLVAALEVSGQLFQSALAPPHVIKAKKRVGAKEGDHLTLINIIHKCASAGGATARARICADLRLNERAVTQALRVRDSLTAHLRSLRLEPVSCEGDTEAVLRCLVSANFANVAQRQPDGLYRNIRNLEVLYLHPHSLLNISHPEWVVYSEVVKTSAYYMREVSEIEHAWLVELAPHYYQDARAKQVEERHTREIKSQLAHDVEKQEKSTAEKQSKIAENLFVKNKKKPNGGGSGTAAAQMQGVSVYQPINLPLKKNSQATIQKKKNANANTLSFGDEEEEAN